MEKLTASEIIIETVKHYRNNPRAVTKHGGCFYQQDASDPDSPKCAVGRCMTPASLDEWGAIDGELDVLLGHTCCELDEILSTRYHGQPFEFWNALQQLHDRRANWARSEGATPLSAQGRRYVQQLTREYTDD